MNSGKEKIKDFFLTDTNYVKSKPKVETVVKEEKVNSTKRQITQNEPKVKN